MPSRAKKRIPRRQAEPFVAQLMREMPRDADWALGGSWRRKAPVIGDLDVMLVTPDGTFGDFRFPASFQAEEGGPQLARGNMHLVTEDQLLRAELGSTLHADFWACKPEQAGAFQMFITGPGRLNVSQRARARKLGLKLSQYGLLRADGSMIPARSEQRIYELLGLDWLEPEQRQRWAEDVIFRSAPEQSWSVPGRPYTVKRKGDYWSCDCKAWKFNRDLPKSCKHIEQRKALLAGVGPGS